MYSTLVRCLLLLGLTLAYVSGETYNTRYDNVNLDQILTNERFLNGYVNCLLGVGGCTPEGLELKKVIPDALLNRCSKCTARQRQGTEKVIRFLMKEKPHLFRQLETKYDPTGYYRQNYAAQAANLRG